MERYCKEFYFVHDLAHVCLLMNCFDEFNDVFSLSLAEILDCVIIDFTVTTYPT